MGIEHAVGTLALAVYLVVVDHAPDSLLPERLEVGGDALAGGLRLAEEPPHLGACRVLRVVETVGKL